MSELEVDERYLWSLESHFSRVLMDQLTFLITSSNSATREMANAEHRLASQGHDSSRVF